MLLIALRKYSQRLGALFEKWRSFYKGYDPTLTWWAALCDELLELLPKYASVTRQELVDVGQSEENAIVGQPTGCESILTDVDAQFIAYTPEELLELGEKEHAWCEREIIEASSTVKLRFRLESSARACQSYVR